MAAVVVNRRRNTVLGSKRGLLLNVNIATTSSDTFDPSSVMRSVDVALADSSTSTAVNTSFTAGSKGPITFQTSSAPQTNVDVLIIGN